MNLTVNKRKGRIKGETCKALNLSALFFLSFLFFISFASAQPPFQVQPTLTEGFFIEIPEQGVLEQGKDYTFFFHIFNISTGMPLTNSSTGCEFNLHDSTSDAIFSDNHLGFDETTTAFSVLVLGENFTTLGTYTYVTHCNSTGFGGVVSVELMVTPSGQSGTDNIVFFVFVILMIYAITFFGFFGKNIPVTILGGMAMLFLGVYTIQQGLIIYRDTLTIYFSYITIALGALVAIWALVEEFN